MLTHTMIDNKVAVVLSENKDGVAAVERALTIMNAFRIEDQALTLHEIANRTGYYKSTILRLVVSLIRFGCIHQLPDATYKLGHTVMKWGSVYKRSLRMEDYVAPVLNQLVDLTGEGASYFRREGDVRLCLFRVDPHHSVRDHLYAGQVLPLDKGAAGRVLMEFDADPSTWGTTRVVFSVGEREPDIAALAAPVFGPDGHVVGAVAISGPSHRFTENVRPAHSDAVLDAAINLTRQFGGYSEWLLGGRINLGGSAD